MKNSIFFIWLLLLTFVKSQEVCPDTDYECNEGQTCCPFTNGYGCCPIEDAVCCSSFESCCPDKHLCLNYFKLCVKNPGVSKRNFTIMLEPLRKNNKSFHQSHVCSEGENQCHDGETCCEINKVILGCCAFPDAVCCGDMIHCCPEGFICFLEGGLCLPGRFWMNIKHSKIQKRQNYVQCPDGGYCNSGNTCCLMSSNTYGCCPFPQAVCCSDKLHCCPGGMNCNSSGYCTDEPDVISWFEKKPTIKRPRNL